MNFFKRTRGFSLLELLVTMIIIGVLAAIVIPVFLNQRSKAFDNEELNVISKNVLSNVSTQKGEWAKSIEKAADEKDLAAVYTLTDEPKADELVWYKSESGKEAAISVLKGRKVCTIVLNTSSIVTPIRCVDARTTGFNSAANALSSPHVPETVIERNMAKSD